MKSIRYISFVLALVMLSSVFCIGCSGDGVNYDAAVALYEAGKYEEAKKAFDAINTYKDSKDWIKKCKGGRYRLLRSLRAG